MEYKDFEKIILSLKETSKLRAEMNKLGVGFDTLNDLHDTSIDLFFNTIWTTEGVSWLNWFIHDNEFGEKDWTKTSRFNDFAEKGLADEKLSNVGDYEDDTPICYDIPSTFSYLKQYER
jgi:hypothetical protein